MLIKKSCLMVPLLLACDTWMIMKITSLLEFLNCFTTWLFIHYILLHSWQIFRAFQSLDCAIVHSSRWLYMQMLLHISKKPHEPFLWGLSSFVQLQGLGISETERPDHISNYVENCLSVFWFASYVSPALNLSSTVLLVCRVWFLFSC